VIAGGARGEEKNMQLEGKVALITGGGTGIGAAIATRFVAEGARVCITGRRGELLDTVAQSLPEGTVATCIGDVTSPDDVQRMIDAALAWGGRLDVLVNNAAIGPAGRLLDFELEVWQQVLAINLTGPFLMMKAAIPHMIEQGGGSIINVASLAGLRALPGSPAYCATKAGLIHLTKQVALDYGPDRVRCNVVCPGATRTELFESNILPMAEALGKDLDTVFAEKVPANMPLRRVAAPGEITGICVYLASDDSSFMTGSVLVIDGGTAIVDVVGATLNETGSVWG
jgi:meso-butanediol dehydrogenase/(S,S)-butanediol dehydrogenase/diacetyl reductase